MDGQHLPTEILLRVISYIPNDVFAQSTLHSFCLVNRQWYDAALARLYEYPKIKPTNFELFVRTLCPSILLRIKKSDLASLVKILDLQHIVHQGSKRITARLLGRTKPSLEVFIAPQSSFAINSWAAIAHCLHLRVLDLSLVCESITLADLRRSVKSLPRLEVLYFPRAVVLVSRSSPATEGWPNLKELHIAGKLDMDLALSLDAGPGRYPSTLTRLSITNCPILTVPTAIIMIGTIGDQLRNLTICSLPQASVGDYDLILWLCPGLLKLSVAIELLTSQFACPELTESHREPLPPHPLRELRLVKTADTEDEFDFTPMDLDDGIDSGFLGSLRRVLVNVSTGWPVDRIYFAQMRDLSASLNELCAEEQLATGAGTRYGLQVERKVTYNSLPLLDW